MSNNNMIQERDNFGSKFGTIMAMAGMAVGLGNVWRFPAMVGEYGGGSFLFAYLLCLFVCVIPFAVFEAGLGKGMGKGLGDTYALILKKEKIGKAIGSIISLSYMTMNFFFYIVVGMSIYMVYACATSKWDVMDATEIYGHAMANKPLMVGLTLVMVVCCGWVLYRGVSGGIEKLSKVMVPSIVFIFVFAIIFCAFSIDQIVDGYNYYLNPDFSKLLSIDIWVAAMGQACFSVGIGPGCVLVYGSHMKEDADVPLSLTTVALFDTGIAITAGLAIMPACIALGVEPGSGSNLIFLAIPKMLSVLPLGNILGILLFLSIFFAGITTAFAQQEVAVTSISDGYNIGRKKVVVVTTVVSGIFALPCVWSEAYIDFWNNFAGNYCFIVSAGIGAIAYFWIYGADRIRTDVLNPTSEINLGKWASNYIKFVATPILIIVMLNSLFPFL
ncbi:MAG: sodium-dependent transporter [Bacillota bacterium]|nr:sodium-dependent transporter [Bacillota bacterium]